MTDRRDLTTSQLITGFSTGYKPQGLIGDLVAPPQMVNRLAGKYRKWGADNLRINGIETLTDDKSETIEIDMTVTSGTYSIKLHGAHALIGREEIEEDDLMEVKMVRTEEVNEVLALQRENDFVSAFFSSANYATGSKAALSAQWDEYACSTGLYSPIVVVQSACQTIKLKTGRRGNAGVMTFDVWRRLLGHPSMTARMSTAANQTIDAIASAMAPILGLEELRVLGATELDSSEGATDNFSFLTTGKMIVYHKPQRMSRQVPMFFMQLQKKGYPRGYQWTEQRKDQAIVIEVRHGWDFVFPMQTCGFMLDTVV